MEAREFDHTVEVRDPKTGRIVSRSDYVLRVGPSGREYERPPGSGMVYDSTGKLLRDENKEKREQMAAEAESKAKAEKAALDSEKQTILDQAKSEADVLRRQIIAEAQAEAEAIRTEAAKVSPTKKGQ